MVVDNTKTVLLKEFVDFCNLSRIYLLNIEESLKEFSKEIEKDLESYNISPEQKKESMEKFNKKIQDISDNVVSKALDSVDNIEVELSNFYHDDDAAGFTRKVMISRNLITRICLSASRSCSYDA